jgi:hypothetical protein
MLKAIAVVLFLISLPAWALSPEAREFMKITKELEPVHCEKRKLRRSLALAEIERRDAEAKDLRARFAALDRDPKTARLEKRLGELERRMSDGKGGTRDPEDLEAISVHQREAYHRCG